MDIFWMLLIVAIIGYLIGSIPFALIVGKLIYKVDVREYGSHNLGSTNVARTLGPLAGLLCLLLDSFKAVLAMILSLFMAKNFMALEYQEYLGIIYIFGGIMAALGHCFPLFAHFKGGKAVATCIGILIGINYKLALIGFGTWLIIVLITKVVSIASISSTILTFACSFIPVVRECYSSLNIDFTNSTINLVFHIELGVLCLLLVLRHAPNIKRIFKKEEKKFRFGKINKEQ